MFQNFVIFLDIENNEDAKSILSSGTTLRGKVFKLVMNCLNDLQIEVRVKSAQVKKTVFNPNSCCTMRKGLW